MKKFRYLLLAAVAGIALMAAAGPLGWFRRGPEVAVISPHLGAIRESFREPAKTRLEDTWKIALQVPGRIGRIDLEPGDRVKKGQVLAEYDQLPLKEAAQEAEATIAQLKAELAVKDDNTLEETSLSEAEQVAKSAEESVRSAEARMKSAQTRLDRAQKELTRIGKLAESGTVSASALDDTRLASDTAQLELSRSEADRASLQATLAANRLESRRLQETITRKRIERQMIVARLAQAGAILERAQHELELAKIVSPIEGVVLERFERGERPLALGVELLLLGNPADIEVIADVLTEDALRLRPGGAVDLESAASGLTLKGKVKRIEPQGFTKLSSLGVEQQRVNVIVGIENPPPVVGVGFRLHARFYTGSKTDATIVPRFAVLQSPDQVFYVLTIEGGKLKKRPVKLGLRSDLEMEVLEGVEPSSLIVAAPDSTMTEGMAVRATLR